MSTIAAISTPHASGGISVIRISGDDALKIAEQIFSPISTHLKATQMQGYTCAYGSICDGDNHYDDGVLTIFKSPRSYTGEDIAEISCHGGIYVTEQILRLILSKGARIAEAGEFTKRAFLNGKMTLTQAEAVMDIISANGAAVHKSAVALREGALFKRINTVTTKLLNLLGELAAWVDYPDDDIPAVDENNMLDTLLDVKAELAIILNEYSFGRIIREGIDTVIVGKPNVGKSTLMNLLSGCERSIVTDIAGTTRDIVEESVRLGNVVLRLSDTAGIRETGDIVESFGVERANKKIETAELILAVFDNSEALNDDDYKLIDKCLNKNAIAIINKSDKDTALDRDYINSKFTSVITISAFLGTGLSELQNILEDMFKVNMIFDNPAIIANERQRICVQTAFSSITNAIEDLQIGMTLDAINILIDDALNALLELTGERATEAVVDEVFSQFCVGK